VSAQTPAALAAHEGLRRHIWRANCDFFDMNELLAAQGAV
jgi:hypothetical protein